MKQKTVSFVLLGAKSVVIPTKGGLIPITLEVGIVCIPTIAVIPTKVAMVTRKLIANETLTGGAAVAKAIPRVR